MGFVFATIAVAAVLMASNRLRYDFIALLVVFALTLGGVLTAGEALAGFGNTVVIMLGGLFVVGEMLERTGIAQSLGTMILKRGQGNPAKLLVLLMLGAAGLGSVMSSTAVVAIFIPIVLKIAAETGISERRLLLPMSYAALISGMLTLIGTPANLVISEELESSGYGPLGFFSMMPLGLVVLAGTIGMFFAFGKLAKGGEDQKPSGPKNARRALAEIAADFDVGQTTRVVRAEIDLSGTALENALSRSGIQVIARRRRDGAGRWGATLFSEGMEVQNGDLLVIAEEDNAADGATEGLFANATGYWSTPAHWLDVVGAADVLIHPEATEIGKNVAELAFRDRYGLEVVAMRRGSDVVPVAGTDLKAGDRLFLIGNWDNLDALRKRSRSFVVLDTPSERETLPSARGKATLALGILAAMILLSVTGWISITIAVLLAAVAAVASGILTASAAYRSVQWPTLVLVAGMMPLAAALEKTGGTQLIVDRLISGPDGADVYAVLAALFFLTAGLSLILSNTATAVLIAPVAIKAAEALSVSPLPFAMAVLIGASAGFASPVSTPVVTLVVAPGGYRFQDFLKAGLPLTLFAGVVAILGTPLFFSF